MIRIEVETAEVMTKSGIAAATGKPYTIREQNAWAYLIGQDGKPNKHPEAMKITLERDQPPYAVGAYTLDPGALYVAQFGKLSIGRIRLNPIQSPVQSVKAA